MYFSFTNKQPSKTNIPRQGPRSIFAIGGAKYNAEGIFSAGPRRKRPRGFRDHAPPEIFKINASRMAKNTSQYSRHSEFFNYLSG